MMLLSLIFIASPYQPRSRLSSRKLLFLRNSGHERQAAGDQAGGQLPFRRRCRPVPSLKFRRWHADTTRKERAEAAEAGKADCHANVSDRQLGQKQQMFCFLDLRSRAILVRGFAKHGLEQPNEMKTGETGRPSHLADAKGLLLAVPQEIARIAESAQQFRMNHRRRLYFTRVAWTGAGYVLGRAALAKCAIRNG